MKGFKPMLGTDIEDKRDLKFPMLSSYKLDGIRCIFKDGQMLSRSLKQIPNKQLQEKFEYLKQYSKLNNVILDGELYSHNLTFQQITSLVMTQDFEDEETIKKLKKRDDLYLTQFFNTRFEFYNPLQFHCFDILFTENILDFSARVGQYTRMQEGTDFIAVKQKTLNNTYELDAEFQEALRLNYEGLILRNPNKLYKFGRSTEKEQGLLKFKEFKTYDAIIRDITREQKSIAEQERDELGNSKRSHKKEFMIDTDKASAFEVIINSFPCKVSLAMTDDEKKEVWLNKEKYIGKWIEFKGMEVGAKNVPRHPVFVRFRDDK
jgi:DNA ligase-1